jgi:hypothetical protein
MNSYELAAARGAFLPSLRNIGAGSDRPADAGRSRQAGKITWEC